MIVLHAPADGLKIIIAGIMRSLGHEIFKEIAMSHIEVVSPEKREISGATC